MRPIFIAEIKTQSPYGYKSEHPFISLLECAVKHGDWVSVHTNSLWGGDFSNIEFVRSFTNKPILAKGLHTTTDSILKAFESGADYVLTTNAGIATTEMPHKEWFKLDTYKDKILFEADFLRVKNLVEFNNYFTTRKYVCNSRNLQTGLPKMKDELPDFLNLGVWTCQASGIKTPMDVKQNVKAFIVGQNLVSFCKEL